MRRFVSSLVLTLSLAACAANPPEGASLSAAAETAPMPTQATDAEPQPGCNAEAARIVIGLVATAEVIDRARAAAGAQVVRTLVPGQIVTMEYHASRLNIDVDAGNVVTNVRCG